MEKHANLGFSRVWTFYSEILASWTMSLSIIIYFFYLLEVFQISGMKHRKK